MKKILWTCLLAALALTGLGLFSPALDLPAEATEELPAVDPIDCEAKCVNDDGTHSVFCASPTFEECCALSERICGQRGGLQWAGCYNSEVGILCDDL